MKPRVQISLPWRTPLTSFQGGEVQQKAPHWVKADFKGELYAVHTHRYRVLALQTVTRIFNPCSIGAA